MTGQMETSIADDKMCAEAAVEKICDYYMQMFSSIDDEMFQQRATDVCDIKTRLLKILLDVEDVDLANVPEGTVLVAEDLTPSMTAGTTLRMLQVFLRRLVVRLPTQQFLRGLLKFRLYSVYRESQKRFPTEIRSF